MKTIKTSFQLNKTSIYIRFTYQKQRLTIATGIVVNPEFWDPKKQRCTMVNSYVKIINKQLNQIEEHVSDVFSSDGLIGQFTKEKGRIPDCEELKDWLNRWLVLNEIKQGSKEKVGDVLEHFTKMVNDRESGSERLKDGKMYSKNRIKQYKTVLKHLENYQEVRKTNFTFNHINKDFHSKFCGYLFEKGLQLNSVGGITTVIKGFMEYSRQLGHHSNMEYKDFQVYKDEPETVYLNLHEITKVKNLKLDDEKEDNFRDKFIIGCFTALRISDFTNIDTYDIEKGTISVKTDKTGASVVIPMHPWIKSIIEKHNGFPKRYGSTIGSETSMFNARIKDICKKAGITDIVNKSNSSGGEKSSTKVEKWKMVGSHTCRRSGATNMVNMGIERWRVMMITGHKTEKSFNRYIRLSQHENAEVLKEHNFFKQETNFTINKAV